MTKNFDKYDNHLFDCDGVILDSNKIKGEVFYKVAAHFSAVLAQELLLFHQKNGGLNRRKKFQYFFENILKKTSYENEFEKALELFQTYNLEETRKADLIPGVEVFLNSLPAHSKKTVVSAGDHDDLVNILKFKNLFDYFDSVWGGPREKKEIIENLNLQGKTVFYGDSEIDYKTASHFDFDFVFISGVCSWPDWAKELSDKKIVVVKDFNEIY
jgi:phosphoglycolate phosphatase-like HAD superfamily hydrolase